MKNKFYKLLNSISDDLNFAKNNPDTVKGRNFHENINAGLPVLNEVQLKSQIVNPFYYLIVKLRFKKLYRFLYSYKDSVLKQFYNLYLYTSSHPRIVMYPGEIGLMENKFALKEAQGSEL